MVFGFFGRRKELEAGNEVEQLRTPSPSIDSASIGKNTSSPKFHVGLDPTATPSPPPEEGDLGLIDDPKPLHALIASVPSKVLHEYILSHLIPPTNRRLNVNKAPIIPPSARTLTHLTSFFSSLTPPPKLHCVRCHKDYFEVENTDRSCLVPHDDESAEVERIGRNKGTDTGTEYETLWGCCGKSVEGDGDMGPPDGWCYEGKHTTDPKRARFRADSTIHDDKLVSCVRMRCSDPPSSPPSSESSVTSATRRKKTVRKPRRAAVAPSTVAVDEEVQENAKEYSEVEQDNEVRSVASSKGKRKAPTVTKAPKRKRARKSEDDKPYKQLKDEETDTDVEMADETTTKRKPRAKPRTKPLPIKKPVSAAVPPQPSTPSPTHSTFSSRSAPNSAKKSALAPPAASSSIAHKKSNVSFSNSPMEIDAPKKDEAPAPRRRAKKLSEAIPSSVDGEGW